MAWLGEGTISTEEVFNENGEYVNGQEYTKVYTSPFDETELYGKVMVFIDTSHNINWENMIVNIVDDLSLNNNLNYKFNHYVACIYIPAYEYEKIHMLLEYLAIEFPQKAFFYKLDYQTNTEEKYKNRNYIYSSFALDEINEETLNEVMETFGINEELPNNNQSNIDI